MSLEEPEKDTTELEQAEVDTGIVESLLSAWRAGDIYLQLSVLGLCVLVVLTVLIFLAWRCYGSSISTVFDTKSKVGIQTQFSGVGDVGDQLILTRSSSYFVPWQQETFPLSPETSKIDQATKKKQ